MCKANTALRIIFSKKSILLIKNKFYCCIFLYITVLVPVLFV